MIDEYPLVYIPMDKLNYKRYSPKFQERFVNHPEYLEWFPRMEKELSTLTRPLAKGKWRNQIESLYQVYQSIKLTKKMWNPLIVMPSRGKIELYYVIRGCQRLCVLRALAYAGDVPCRVAKITDTWNDNTQAYYTHPYVNINFAMY